MNKLIYFLLEKINKNNNSENIYVYLENLYNLYICPNAFKEYEIDMTKGQFKTLISSIHDVLKYRLDMQEFRLVITNYIKLLSADAISGNNVDVDWAINHIYYLTVGSSNEINTEKYKDCIMFIQDKLINEFCIEENVKEKVNRKIYTACMNRF